MSGMKDVIRLSIDLGKAVKGARKEIGIKATAIARHSGRSRDILNRLERGEDITVSSLFDILAAMGLVMRLERAGLPTLDEMTARFANLDDDDDAP
jgi:HTH-type transcriptional regulator/antitoxin HipB